MEHIYSRSRFVCLAVASLAIVGVTAGVAAADTITLGWNSNSEPTVVGYMVHVGTQSGNYTQHLDVGFATMYGWTGAVAGQRYCFAVSAYVGGHMEGARSNEVCGYSNQPPTLLNPGTRTSVVGQSTNLQLQGTDPDGRPVTYAASGLPPGLSLMSSTGFISGTPTAAGSSTVTATVSDGVLTSSQTFTWTVASSGDATVPTVTISGPTSATTFTTTTAALTLSGTASDNVGVTQVTWASDRGGNGTATGTTNWSTGLTLVGGANVLTVTARDASGNTSTDSLTVTYTAPTSNTAPIVNAGPDKSATLGTSISLVGTASDDGQPTPARLTPAWTPVSGPGTVSFTSAASLSTSATFSTVGTYVLRLSVSDGAMTSSDDVTVTISLSSTGLTGTGLTAEYFSGNAPLVGLLTTRVDPNVNFNWGTGSPGPGIPADYFSTRWSGEIVAPVSGTYTFSTVADDAVRLWVNNQQVIDNWVVRTSAVTTTGMALTLQAGQRYPIRLEYYDTTGQAMAVLQWSYPGQAMQIVPQNVLFPTGSAPSAPPPSYSGSGTGTGTGTGLRGEYFKGFTFDTTPVMTRVDPTVNFSWGLGSPTPLMTADGFVVRWTGTITAPVSGTYVFSTVSDDGARLWVNNQQLINHWSEHTETTDTAFGVTLQAGQTYSIRLEYYESGGPATIKLQWAYPGMGTQIIPQSALNP